MLTFLTIAGGVALILFGVRYVRKGLDRLFGSKLGVWMQHMAGNRIRAFFAGIGISIVAPSSTTMSVLAVQTVQAGHLNTRQMLAVMLGADIGMTITVLLIALRIEQYAPILALAGMGLFQFTQGVRSRGIGQVLLAFSFIFIGVATIRAAAGEVGDNRDIALLVEVAEHRPLIMALLAMVMAILLQSSTATIGLVIGLGHILSMNVAIPAVAGANVGIVITTLIVGWKQLESRRLAVANLLSKSIIAAIILLSLNYFAPWMEELSGLTLAGKIAAVHTGFNVLMALVCLPLIVPLTRLVETIVPAPRADDRPAFGPRHITSLPTDSLNLALGQSMREIMHVGEIVRAMLKDLWTALKTSDQELARRVSIRDDQVDLLDTEIKRFLTRLAGQGLDENDAAEQMRQLRYLAELETIGDVIDKNLSELVLKKIRQQTGFSKEDWAELDDFHQKVAENLLIADTAFTTRDVMLAQQLLRHKERINNYERELRDRHFARLNAGKVESYETSAIYLDILTQLKRINSSVSHVAYSILQDTQSKAAQARTVE